MTKDELELAIKSANLWSGRSTLILAVGILGEYALLPFLEKKRWQKSAKIFFAVLVVAGIVGEYKFSSMIAQHADELQRLSDQEVARAAAQAVAANERSSKTDERSKQLEASNKQLGIDLETEKQKTARFQKEADEARLALENRVKLQGRRAKILDENKTFFVEHLKRFAPQPITVVECGAWGTPPPEQFELEQHILNWIGTTPDGAGWNIGYVSYQRCSATTAGNMIWVNSKVNPNVLNAANALKAELNSIGLSTNLLLSLSEYADSVYDPGSPGALAKQDRTRVFLLVGRNPN